MPTEREEWIADVTAYALKDPHMSAQGAVKELRADTVPAFGRFWHRMSRVAQSRFLNEANDAIQAKRIEAEREGKIA